MADDFKAFVLGQKKTNDKLEQLIKNDDASNTATSIIAQSLPEILSDRNIQSKSEKFDKKEGVTEVDEAVSETTKAVKEGNKNLVVIGDSLSKANKIEQGKIAAATGSGAEESGNKTGKFLKGLRSTAGFFGKMAKFMGATAAAKKFVSTAGSIWSKVLKAGLIGGTLLLLNFLTGPSFSKFYDNVVNLLIPAAAAIGGKLLNAFEGLLDVIDGKKGIIEFIGENKAVVATIALALGGKGMFSVLAKGVGLLGTGITKAWGSAAVKTFLGGAGGQLLSVGLLYAGFLKATKDGFDGLAKSEEWGVDKFAATFGGALAGTKKEFAGATEQATKWAAILGGAGLFVFPPLGAVIGGALGLVIGGILGYFGGEEVAKGTQKLVDKFKVGWEQLIFRMSDSLASYGDAITKFLGFDIDEEEATKREKRRDLRMLPGKIEAEEMKLLIEKIKLRKLIEDVANDDSNFFLKESYDEQQNDRSELSELTKQIEAREVELSKMRSALTVNVLQPKALGGPVVRNNPYIVGEEGPELFIPGISGNIMPNSDKANTASGAGTNIVNAPTSVVNNQSTQGIIGAPVSLIDISLAAGMARHGGTVFA